MSEEIQQIREELRKLGDGQRAINSKRYLKSPYEFYGLKVPEIRNVAKKYKNLEFHSALNLFDELWNSGNHEEMSFALFLLGSYVKKYPEQIWKFLLERIEKAKTWDHTDELSSHILGIILADDIRIMSDIKEMSEAKNPWIRRISIISTSSLIKKNKIDLTLRLAEKLVYDKDIYVQKGAGWMLREAGKKNRLAVREFIIIHMNMKPFAFSYATEKMTELRKIKKEMAKKIKEERKMQEKINLNKFKQNKSIRELLEFGIINIDKPPSMTSFDVSDFVRKKLKDFGVRKTSHFGTLDPMVTGVLPIALNRAVKLTGFFLGEDKEYIGMMKIHEDISVEKIEEAIKKGFIGKIMQMPPVKSRVKRQEREREIKNFKILRQEGRDVSFAVECQGGTYIRKLVHDLGLSLGVGAHMTKLKRIRAGIFKEEEMVSKEDFELAVKQYEKGNDRKLKEMIIPAEIISEIYPVVEVKKEFVDKLFHGAPIDSKFLIKKEKIEKGKIISVFSGEQFVGMYKVINEKDILAKPEFVLQEIRN